MVPPSAKNLRRIILLGGKKQTAKLRNFIKGISIYQYLWKININKNVTLIVTIKYSLIANAQAIKKKKNSFFRLNLLDYDLQICGILSRKRSGNGGYLKNKSIEYKIFNFMVVFF